MSRDYLLRRLNIDKFSAYSPCMDSALNTENSGKFPLNFQWIDFTTKLTFFLNKRYENVICIFS